MSMVECFIVVLVLESCLRFFKQVHLVYLLCLYPLIQSNTIFLFPCYLRGHRKYNNKLTQTKKYPPISTEHKNTIQPITLEKQMSSPGENSSLRPSWFKGTGSGGGKGFQPPPTAADRGDKGRSSSFGSAGDGRRDSNKFAALLDDDDVVVGNGVETSSNKPPPSSNSRSEAFRSSFNRSASTGNKPAATSLSKPQPSSAMRKKRLPRCALGRPRTASTRSKRPS